jgi:hypothetical protein
MPRFYIAVVRQAQYVSTPAPSRICKFCTARPTVVARWICGRRNVGGSSRRSVMTTSNAESVPQRSPGQPGLLPGYPGYEENVARTLQGFCRTCRRLGPLVEKTTWKNSGSETATSKVLALVETRGAGCTILSGLPPCVFGGPRVADCGRQPWAALHNPVRGWVDQRDNPWRRCADILYAGKIIE